MTTFKLEAFPGKLAENLWKVRDVAVWQNDCGRIPGPQKKKEKKYTHVPIKVTNICIYLDPDWAIKEAQDNYNKINNLIYLEGVTYNHYNDLQIC